MVGSVVLVEFVVLVGSVVVVGSDVVDVEGDGVTHGSTVGVGSAVWPDAGPPAKELINRATAASAATSETWIQPVRCCWSAMTTAPEMRRPTTRRVLACY